MKKIFIAFEVSTAIIVSGLTNGLSLKLTKIESKIYSLELLLYKSKPFIEIYSIVVLRKNCCFFLSLLKQTIQFHTNNINHVIFETIIYV